MGKQKIKQKTFSITTIVVAVATNVATLNASVIDQVATIVAITATIVVTKFCFVLFFAFPLLFFRFQIANGFEISPQKINCQTKIDYLKFSIHVLENLP